MSRLIRLARATAWATPALFLTVTLGAAYLQGRATGRWVPLSPLGPYTEALVAVPDEAGSWVGTDAPLDDPDSLARAGIAGHLSRRYRDRATGEEVTVLVVAGRPGPISVHTPDVCYRGAGYTAVGDAARTAAAAGGRQVPLWGLRFRPPAARAGAADLEIRWGWLAGAGLEAPANARLAYAGLPALYKLYVIRERRPRPTAAAAAAATPPAAVADPTEAFLAAFLPALETALGQTPPAK